VSPDPSHAPCAICRRGHDPESPCSVAADADERGRIGEVLGERYELVRLIGAGGMGVVYEARHKLIGRRFAVKLLHPQYAQQASMLARFQREARAAGSLENDHIAAVTDFGFAADGAPFLVMEHLDGEDLSALLAREGPLPVGRAAALVIQACRGLAAAHANDIVHRDLKPANLFLTRRSDGADLVKVLDFGIAKLLDANGTGTSITGTGKLLGTACYMPPEQAKGDPDLDHRSDIYALGAILYELLTATKAHPGTNYNAVLFHILTQQCEPLAKLRPDAPPGLGAVVERAMAFERGDRYDGVEALGEALLPFAAEAAPARDTPPPRPSIKPVSAVADTIATPVTAERPRASVIAASAPAAAPRRRSGAVAAVTGFAVIAGVVVWIARQAGAPTPAAPPPPPAVRVEAPPAPAPAPRVEAPAPAPAKPVEVLPAPPPAAPPRPAAHHRRPKPHASTPGKPAPSDGEEFDTRNPYDE
jgi:serine/threonine-protein kinase